MKNWIKRKIIQCIWKNHRDFLLNKKGFENNIIHFDNNFLDLFFEIYSQNRAILTIREMHNIYNLVQKVEHIKGDIAEIGVYKGGSARIICEVKNNKSLYLFDTFEGLPETNKKYDKVRKGTFCETSLKNVKTYLSKFNNVNIYKGLFPECINKYSNIPNEFSFVNLDVDIYKSTLDSLEFFYPKMNKHGIILSHDYHDFNFPGVKKAFDEFFADKPEMIIELWDTQCLIIKQ